MVFELATVFCFMCSEIFFHVKLDKTFQHEHRYVYIYLLSFSKQDNNFIKDDLKNC